MRTDHLVPCLVEPIPSCAIWGSLFAGIDVAQRGAPFLRTWGFYAGGLSLYHATVCPMEVIHGRRSSLQ